MISHRSYRIQKWNTDQCKLSCFICFNAAWVITGSQHAMSISYMCFLDHGMLCLIFILHNILSFWYNRDISSCNCMLTVRLQIHSQKERYKTVPFKVQVAVTGVVPWRVQCCTSSQRYNIVPSSFVPFKGQFCTSRNICTQRRQKSLPY